MTLNDLTTFFSNTQLALLSGAVLSVAAGLYFHVRDREKPAVLFLMLAGACLFCFAAVLDPFLNLWDERFHALVAKNHMKHPFLPTLYDDPVVNMAYDRWDRYHVWLHKQPLFLWQITLSFRLFGISEFTLRLPDILMGTATVYAVYRSGKLLVSKDTGMIAALFFMSTFYFLELAAGRQELEHNDFAFLAYTTLSIWAYIEYVHSGKRHWVILTGLFSGFAILCKWLPGLLVYLGWAIHYLYDRKFSLHQYRAFFKALLVTLLIALPWQVYTFVVFPAEAAEAYRFNALHFTVPLDGHRGDALYHIDRIDLIYGRWAAYFMIPAFVFLFFRMNKAKRGLFLALTGMVAWVYLFYSVVATKMPSFTTIAVLPVLISFASLFEALLNRIRKWLPANPGKVLFVLVVLGFFIYRFDLQQFRIKHSPEEPGNRYSRMLIHNREVFRSLDLPENTVLFNVKGRHYVEAMFYTGLPAYNFIPDEEQFDNLLDKNRRIAVFCMEGDTLPSYLAGHPSVIPIGEEIGGYE